MMVFERTFITMLRISELEEGLANLGAVGRENPSIKVCVTWGLMSVEHLINPLKSDEVITRNETYMVGLKVA